MKAIDVSKNTPTLMEILDMAGEENVVLKTAEGRQFVLAEIDDFQSEIDAVTQNRMLMEVLDERSRDTSRLSLEQVHEQLAGKKKRKTR